MGRFIICIVYDSFFCRSIVQTGPRPPCCWGF